MSYDGLRTPDQRFEALPGYPYTPNYLEWNGLRMHYLDEGQGEPVVLFHGEPTWSFLYRKVLDNLVAAGRRVIAPDYFGFGRSDKPTDPDFYTYDRHVASMKDLMDHLDVDAATAVVQDWGGPIGLRVATEMPRRFGRITIMNTGLYAGRAPSDFFMAWRSFVEQNPDLPVGMIMRNAAIETWDEAVFDAYQAPYPAADHKVGAHRFPLIVPIAPEDPGASEMAEVLTALSAWDRPAQVLFSTSDPVFSPKVGQRFVDAIPGASGLETIDGAGHFLQEDQGEEVGKHIAAFLDRTA